MCGIAGILRVHPPGSWPPGAAPPPPDLAIPEPWLDILDDSIKHRGPDGHGRFRDRATRPDGSVVDVALVHRRLSIIDHKDGHQPMVSPHGPAASQGTPTVREGPETRSPPGAHRPSSGNLVAVVFNGCIYNHRALRRELTAAGHQFVTDHSDTEVLIHGWREWGVELSSHLDGMYAYIIWDQRSGDIYFGRDLANEKPLHLYDRYVISSAGDWTVDLTALASTPSALTALLPAVERPAEPATEDWVGDWIRFGFSEDSAINGVAPWRSRAMLHGSAERFHSSTHRLTELPSRDGTVRLNVDSADSLLRDAVRSRLEADVPLGCFLSGGIDSALVAHYAKEAAGAIRTFTVAMPDPRFDESRVADAAARIIGSNHKTLPCDASPASDLVHLITQLGLPFGDSSLLPTYWVSKAARKEVTVALSGDGGDELFCGYERHVAARRLGRIHRALALLPTGAIPDRYPKSPLSKLRRLAQAAKHGYPELLAVFQMPDLRQLLPQLDFAWYDLTPFHEEDPAGTDFWTYLGPDVLTKVDTASMAVPLEVRSPFLASAVVNACLRAPYEDLMPRGQRKGLLRQVASRYLPPEIVNRPKQGFAIPIGDWFRTDYGGMKTLLLDHLNSTEPWGSPSLGIDLNMKFVRQMLDEHMTQKRDHSQRLYMLLVLSIWAMAL